MFHCTFCKTGAHARTNHYLSENVKQRYHQCVNIECLATFRTLNPLTRLSVHRRQSRSSWRPNRQPPLTVLALKHDQSSGETYVTSLTIHKAFTACQANKSAWLLRREELTQAEQAYREQA